MSKDVAAFFVAFLKNNAIDFQAVAQNVGNVTKISV